jgi:hypothetical protein
MTSGQRRSTRLDDECRELGAAVQKFLKKIPSTGHLASLFEKGVVAPTPSCVIVCPWCQPVDPNDFYCALRGSELLLWLCEILFLIVRVCPGARREEINVFRRVRSHLSTRSSSGSSALFLADEMAGAGFSADLSRLGKVPIASL